jgi:WD40 repeat protein
MLRCIGRGSYGEVWLARSVMGTFRAVKLVYRHRFEEVRPFERELSGIQKFEPISRSHDGLVDILQVGRNDKAGYFYYVMELADDASQPAGSMAPNPESYVPRTLGHEFSSRGRLPPEECLPLFVSLASGLSHLHQHGLIHRDIKPSNIIFVNGVAKLADIGLVSEAGRSDSYVGTEGYIPPEGPGTAQADIYSLGKLFYELSTGQDRTNFPSLPLQYNAPDKNRGLLELDAVFVRACANNLRDRYRSADEMHADLALLQSGKSVRRLRTMERRLVQAARAGVAAACLLCVAMGAYLFTHYQAHVAQENFRKAEAQRLRAERAEQSASEQLCRALLAQARAGRRSTLAGHRLESLQAIARAVEMLSPTNAEVRLQLRNEAIAALALTDLRPVNTAGQMFHPSPWFAFDAPLERYLDLGTNGDLRIRSSSGPPDSADLVSLPGAVPGPVLGFEFSPDGRHVQVVDTHRQCNVWDLERRKIIFTSSTEPACWLWEFAPDNHSLAFGFTNGLLVFREIATGETNRTLNLPADFREFKFRPDGRACAIWRNRNHTLEIRDTETGSLLHQWPFPGRLREMVWSPTGRRLATVASDLNSQIWDVSSTNCFQTLRGHGSVVTWVGFLGDDDVLASSSWDSTLRFWSVPNGKQILESRTGSSKFRYSPQKKQLGLLLERGAQSEARLLDVIQSEVVREFWEQTDQAVNGPWAVAFNPDGRSLASGSADGVHLYNLGTSREAAHISAALTTAVRFDDGGKTLTTCSTDALLRFALQHEPDDQISFRPLPCAIPGPSAKFTQACFAPCGDAFAATQSGPIQIFRSGTNAGSLTGSEGAHNLAASPDGQWVAAGFRYWGGVRVWRVADGHPVREFRLGNSSDVVFSPDSRWLLAGSAEEFQLWNLATAESGLRIPREENPGLVGHAAFSKDGKLLAVSLTQWLVALLDPSTGRELARLEHPNAQMISKLAFSPSGQQLAVATEGHVIQLWDIQRLRHQLATLKLNWDDPL